MRVFTFCLGLSLLGWSSCLLATQDQTYGLGGPTSGRASGVTAEVENPYAAIFNPALLAAQPSGLFAFSTFATEVRFDSMKNVLLDSRNFRTRNAEPRVGDYQLPDVRAALWAAGLTYPFSFPRSWGRRGGIGLVVAGPFDRLRSYSGGTPYEFSLLRYGTSDTQFKATLGTAVEILPEHLYLGGALSLFLTSSGAADVTLFADNPTGRLNLEVGLNTAAVAGLLARAGDDRVGLVFRQAIHPALQQSFSGKAYVGGQETFHEPFLLRGSLYYEPHILELEWQRDFGLAKASVGVSYQLWKGYRPSYLIVETQAREGPRVTSAPPPSLRNTWNPRASVEVPFFGRRLAVSAGYQYRPSPLTDLSGITNLLDSDTHVLGISVQHRVSAGEIIPFPFSWSVFGQYHWLNSRRVEKKQTDFIGAPAYDFSGRAFVYGLSVQAEL